MVYNGDLILKLIFRIIRIIKKNKESDYFFEMLVEVLFSLLSFITIEQCKLQLCRNHSDNIVCMYNFDYRQIRTVFNATQNRTEKILIKRNILNSYTFCKKRCGKARIEKYRDNVERQLTGNDTKTKHRDVRHHLTGWLKNIFIETWCRCRDPWWTARNCTHLLYNYQIWYIYIWNIYLSD